MEVLWAVLGYVAVLGALLVFQAPIAVTECSLSHFELLKVIY